MSTVNSVTTSGIGSSSPAPKTVPPQMLNQTDFLKLMTAQLQAQDPLKPLDNSQFVSQMAQFSTVSGIQSMQDSFNKLAASLQSTNMLQASGLVGHNVLVPGSSVALTDTGSVQAAADLPASGKLVVDVTDASGQVFRQLDLGAQPAGLASFNWDGLDSVGQRLVPGTYKLNARLVNGEQTQSATTYIVGRANSVSLDSSGSLNVDVQNQGPVAFGNIRQIM